MRHSLAVKRFYVRCKVNEQDFINYQMALEYSMRDEDGYKDPLRDSKKYIPSVSDETNIAQK